MAFLAARALILLNVATLTVACDDDVTCDSDTFEYGVSLLQSSKRIHSSTNASTQPYYWSSGRGSVGSYSVTTESAPDDISTPTWVWHDRRGEWAATSVGVAIDEQENMYLTVTDGLHKFSSDGNHLWKYTRPQTGPYSTDSISKAVAIMDGVAFGIWSSGRVFAVRMETGEEVWTALVSDSGADGNYGHIAANDGVVIAAAEVSSFINRTEPPMIGPSNHKVLGLSAENGTVLWTYRPAIPVWNFGAAFVGDGTFVFQDLEGKVHRNRASDGTLVWANGGIPGSWTDGQSNLGNNGIVYGVANYGNPSPEGCISAYRVSDGKMLWRQDVPKSPNSVPAVGKLFGHTSLSVVIPVGENDQAGKQLGVFAFDAKTGEKQWVFDGPVQTVSMGIGDANPQAFVTRTLFSLPVMTLPNSWGTPVIGGNGAVYVGGTTGHFFALKDTDGDGKVAGGAEVSVLSTNADWTGSSGAAIAPGLLAVGNSNSLMVWKY